MVFAESTEAQRFRQNIAQANAATKFTALMIHVGALATVCPLVGVGTVVSSVGKLLPLTSAFATSYAAIVSDSQYYQRHRYENTITETFGTLGSGIFDIATYIYDAADGSQDEEVWENVRISLQSIKATASTHYSENSTCMKAIEKIDIILFNRAAEQSVAQANNPQQRIDNSDRAIASKETVIISSEEQNNNFSARQI